MCRQLTHLLFAFLTKTMIHRKRLYLLGRSLFVAIMVMFAGVATGNAKEVPLSQCNLTNTGVIDRLDIRLLVASVVEEICSRREIEDIGPENIQPVIIPDAVDTVDLVPGEMGILIGELTRESVFNTCGLPIRQVEISQKLRLNLNGLTMLSRDPYRSEISEVPASEAVVGAYQLKQGRLVLTIRRIRLEDSVIKSIKTKQLNWRCEKPLLRDPRLFQEVS